MQTMIETVVTTDTLRSGNQYAVRREFSYREIVTGIGLIALVRETAQN